MKILKRDFRKGYVVILIEDADDLWHISTLITPTDQVKARTIRKIKIGGEDERKTKIVKKPVMLTLSVEKIDYSGQLLRISGQITQGPEDIPKGSYHTINVEVGTQFTLLKPMWMKHEQTRLKEATKKKTHLLLCIHDREEALIAKTKPYGSEVLAKLTGEVQKKKEGTKARGNFYKELSKVLQEYDKRLSPETIIVASPAFYKEDFLKQVPAELNKKIITATCHSVSQSAIAEVLNRPETSSALAQNRLAQETKIIEKLLAQISKEEKAVYGWEEVSRATKSGAIQTLLVADSFIAQSRILGNAKKVDDLMKVVEGNQGDIHIISTSHESGKKLEGLGGIAALTRYKV